MIPFASLPGPPPQLLQLHLQGVEHVTQGAARLGGHRQRGRQRACGGTRGKGWRGSDNGEVRGPTAWGGGSSSFSGGSGHAGDEGQGRRYGSEGSWAVRVPCRQQGNGTSAPVLSVFPSSMARPPSSTSSPTPTLTSPKPQPQPHLPYHPRPQPQPHHPQPHHAPVLRCCPLCCFSAASSASTPLLPSSAANWRSRESGAASAAADWAWEEGRGRGA